MATAGSDKRAEIGELNSHLPPGKMPVQPPTTKLTDLNKLRGLFIKHQILDVVTKTYNV